MKTKRFKFLTACGYTFKAYDDGGKNGEYTITVNPENVEMKRPAESLPPAFFFIHRPTANCQLSIVN